MLTPERDGLRIEHRPLDYAHERAAAKMRAAHLPKGYAAALSTGLWPSCDVLPPAEARQTGEALAPSSASWPHAPSDRAHGKRA